MKKIFSLFAAVLMAGSMMAADPVVLTFSDWGDATLNKDSKPNNTVGDCNTALTTTSLIDSLKGAAGFVTCSATSKCYAARVGYGCKLGSSSAIGSFTLNLVTPAEFDSIVVRCASYGASEGSLSINGGTAIDLTDGGKSNKVLRDVKITPAGEVSTLSIATTVKRAFVKSITFYPHESAPVVTPVVLAGAATAEAINITTESTGTWYGGVLNEYYYLMQSSMMSNEVLLQFLTAQGGVTSEAGLYTGNKSFNIADLTFMGEALTPGKYYFLAGGIVVDDDPMSDYGFANNGEAIVVEFTVAEPEPTNCWDDLEWLGDGAQGGALSNKYKVCKPSNVGVVNIQNSFGTEAGIYVTFPEAGLSCDLGEGKYAVQGAGMLLYISAFTAKVTEVVVTSAAGTYNLTVYYADGQDAPAEQSFEVVAGATTFTVTPSDLEAEYYIEVMPAGYTEAFLTTYVDGIIAEMGAGLEYFSGVQTQSYADDWYMDEPGDYVILVCGINATYTARTTDVIITPFTISPASTINYWLVGPAAENGWDQTKAMPMPGDSIVRHLNAGTYEFKVLTQEGSWTGALGFANLNAEASSANVFGDDNVCFELENEGDVTIKVVEGQIVVLGTFKEQVAYDYYIKFAGNNWTWVGMTQAPSGVYMYEGVWGGTGANVNTQNNNNGAVWYPEADIFFGTEEMKELPVPAVGTVGYYVYIPDAEPAPMLAFLYNGTPTAVENVEAVKAVKVIENGQVVIIRDGIRYNAAGLKL